jgi:hypothetical protein
VVVVEIDSGAKQSSQPGHASESSGLLEPYDAIINAGYTNADIAKERHRDKINLLLTSARDRWLERQREPLSLDNQHKLDKLAAKLPNPLVYYPFQCERFQLAGGESRHYFFAEPSEEIAPVMTAWALTPAQRGRVISHFLIELGAWRGNTGHECRQMAGDLRFFSDSLQLLADLRFREEVGRAMPVFESAMKSKGSPRYAREVSKAINRLNVVQQDRESRPLARDFAKIMSQEGVSRLDQSLSASPNNGEEANPEAFRKDVARLKNGLVKVMKDTGDVSRKVDDAIAQAPAKRENLERAQRAIDQKAHWTSRMDEPIAPAKTP